MAGVVACQLVLCGQLAAFRLSVVFSFMESSAARTLGSRLDSPFSLHLLSTGHFGCSGPVCGVVMVVVLASLLGWLILDIAQVSSSGTSIRC